MSVPYLRQAAAANDTEKLVRFVRFHLGDGNEAAGRKEIDRSWAEAIKTLTRYEQPNTRRSTASCRRTRRLSHCSTFTCTFI